MHDETRIYTPDRDATRTHSPDLGDSTRAQSYADAKRTGQMLSRPEVTGYQLLEEVGQGGMGIVYRARDLNLNRDVAVKILQDRIAADGPTAKRFLEEAQITGQLQHPGIPAVHQVGRLASGRPFLAMKLIKGRSLADMLAEKEPITVLAVFEQIAQAVGYAHAHNVIHRDLKPANVMVGAFGEVQVMDWGLAKVLTSGGTQSAAASTDSLPHETQIHSDRDSDSDQLSRAGSAIGTAAFMPPEQAIGAHERMGPPSDVFGLGAVLCTLLTGEAPYSGETWEATRQQAAMAVQGPMLARLAASGAEPELAALCRHCLAPDPKDRPANGAAVAEAVARLRAAAEERAKQAEVDRARAEVQAAEQRKRRRVQMAFGSAVLAALVIGSAVAGWQAWEANQSAAAERNATQQAEARKIEAEAAAKIAIEQKQRADDEAEKTRLANEALKKQSQEQRRLLDVMRIKEAGRSFDNNLVEYARELLGEVAAENRTSAWHLAMRYFEGSDFLHYRGDTVNSVAWSPDGRTMAIASENIVRLLDPLNGECVKEFKGHVNPVRVVAWSPDGRSLASLSEDGSIRIWDVANGISRLEIKGYDKERGSTTLSLAWSPDGRMLASAGFDLRVRIWDAASGENLKEIRMLFLASTAIAWSPDSRTLAAVEALNTVWLFDVASGRRIGELEGHTGMVMSIAWNPDGQRIATASIDSTLRIWDAKTRDSIKEIKGQSNVIFGSSNLAWSPDGRSLAGSGYDGRIQIWDADGQKIKELQGHTEAVTSITWSPDGRHLASGSRDQTLRIWDARTEPEIEKLISRSTGAAKIAWNHDGRSVAIGTLNKNVRILDAASGRMLKEMTAHDAAVTCVAWSPDGKILATCVDSEKVSVIYFWDARGKKLAELKGHTGQVKGMAWRPDSKLLATASWDNTVRLWDASGQFITLLQHDNYVSSVAWSPDGLTLASAAWPHSVRLWDINGKLLKELTVEGGMPTQVCWSPDGRWLAAANLGKQVRLWEPATGQCTRVLNGHNSIVLSVAWCPDGRILASGSGDRTVRLWDTATGQSLIELKGHMSPVMDVAWSPDGHTLASVSSWDKAVRFWHAEKGPAVQELLGHSTIIDRIERSRDGRRIVSTAKYRDPGDPKNEKTLDEKLVWDAATGERLKDAPIPELADPANPPDDGFQYIIYGTKILKVSKAIAPEELDRRRKVLAPQPEWHREQAAECRNQSNWFAAAFHLRRLLALEPNDTVARTRLAAAEKKLQIREVAPLPKRVD